MNQLAFSQKRKWLVWNADVVALLGLLIYIIQSIVFAHTAISSLDEGAYLLKGLLFSTGKYHPFDPGISTNKGPWAFLIPGYIQLVFGAGLRTGRYLAVFFGVMAVVGTWIASRRMGGKWLAAAAVWVFSLSPAIIKIYSVGVTQSTIACMLAWALAFSLGEKRPLWQLILSGFFAGALMLVRQNMMPVLPLLAVYVFWEHGRKVIGLLLSGLTVVIVVHIIYWPDILQLWNWVPFIQIPAEMRYSGGGTPRWSPETTLFSRVLSIFQAVRFHFVALVGSIISPLLWLKFKSWKNTTDFRAGLFLFFLFWGLVYMHSVAAIGKDYCVFCFTPYISFFNVAGILLVVVSIKSWNWQPSTLVQVVLIVVMFVVFTGVGFSAFEDLGPLLLKLPSPRIRDLRILPGFVTWWDILSNKFNISYNVAIKYVSTAFGLFVCGLFMLIGYNVWRRVWRDKVGFVAFWVSAILVLDIFLSPVLHGSAGIKDCTTDVILANENIGTHLRSIIPKGSTVYWNGGLSAVPLLYLPEAEIFPAQINSSYSFFSHGDTEQLYKFGLWNEEMDDKWKATAQFFIIEEERYFSWKDFLNPEQFDEFARSPEGTSCLEESRLRIFRRK